MVINYRGFLSAPLGWTFALSRQVARVWSRSVEPQFGQRLLVGCVVKRDEFFADTLRRIDTLLRVVERAEEIAPPPMLLRGAGKHGIVVLSAHRFERERDQLRESWGPSQFGALTASQIQALTTSQIANGSVVLPSWMTPAQIGSVTPNQASALTTGELQILTPSQIAALTPAAISALSNAQLGALSSNQIAALTASQISALNISAAPEELLLALGASQLQALTNTQIVALSTNTIESFSTAQIAALLPSQISSLSAEQLAAFSSICTALGDHTNAVAIAGFQPACRPIAGPIHRIYAKRFHCKWCTCCWRISRCYRR